MTVTLNIEVIDTGKFEKDFAALQAHVQKGMRNAIHDTAEHFAGLVKVNITQSPHGRTSSPHEPGGHYFVLGTSYDHPFSRRHFMILPHDHDPEWGVHTVGGQMLAQFGTSYLSEPNYEYAEIGWNPDTVTQEVRDVLEGNSKMKARPVLQLTLDDMFPPLESIALEKLTEYLEGIKWQMV